MPRRSGFGRDEAGATALEFALTVIPFLLLLVGAIELSRLLWTRQAMQSLATSAARCMGVLQTQCSAHGVYSAQNTTGFIIGGARALGVGLTPADLTLTPNASCGGVAGFAQVAIVYRFSAVTPLLGLLARDIPLRVDSCFPMQP